MVNFYSRLKKFEEDGFTNAGDARFKLHFKGVEAGTKEPIFIMNSSILDKLHFGLTRSSFKSS